MITATQKIVKIGEKAKCRFTSIDDEVDVIVKRQGAKDYELVVEKDGKEYLARQMYFGGLVVNDGPSAAHLAARKEEEAKRKAVLASLQEVLRLSSSISARMTMRLICTSMCSATAARPSSMMSSRLSSRISCNSLSCPLSESRLRAVFVFLPKHKGKKGMIL